MKQIAAIAIIALLLGGCNVEQQEVGENEFEPSKIAYFKDARTETCYAVVSYQRMDTSGRAAAGLSHSAVPCTPAIEKLVRK